MKLLIGMVLGALSISALANSTFLELKDLIEESKVATTKEFTLKLDPFSNQKQVNYFNSRWAKLAPQCDQSISVGTSFILQLSSQLNMPVVADKLFEMRSRGEVRSVITNYVDGSEPPCSIALYHILSNDGSGLEIKIKTTESRN